MKHIFNHLKISLIIFNSDKSKMACHKTAVSYCLSYCPIILTCFRYRLLSVSATFSDVGKQQSWAEEYTVETNALLILYTVAYQL